MCGHLSVSGWETKATASNTLLSIGSQLQRISNYLNLWEAAALFAGLMMKSKFTKTLCLTFFLILKTTSSSEDNFTFNGFIGANLTLDGLASITSNGLLELTNTTRKMMGHAFHPVPLHFKSRAGKTLSFSTTFVFAILPGVSDVGGHGIAFVISPTNDLSNAFTSQYLGLLNRSNNGNSTNHIFAVELDTFITIEFQDIDDNHVGIDINSLKSYKSHTAGYFNNSGSFQNLTLISGQQMQVWVDFDGEEMQLNVTLCPVGMPKPNRPLLSSIIDLSSVLLDSMYVGFSASTGTVHSSHCILGWSFMINGVAGSLDYAKLPLLRHFKAKRNFNVMVIWVHVPIVLCLFVLSVAVATFFIVRRRMKYAELLEDWEREYGPHRFSYKELFHATKGFKEKELLGIGGFGRVYRGVLPSSKMEIAVKKVSHESRQGLKEFVAEIVSIGLLRHRNLVQLLGYCRRKGELLLVYDFMPNGSLDKFLYDRTKPTLDWAQRFRIIKGVASGLLYLHEDWEQVVVHRDIKASNVLLDSELNGRLGDFGLARLYDHGTDPQTTHVVGTMGYLAPELARNGKATTVTDVFAFGAFLLEVVCCRRPVHPHVEGGEVVLVDLVLENWRKGVLIETMDPYLREEYCSMEVELVLKLGLICSHPFPAARPSMRQAMQILDGDVELPELLPSALSFSSMSIPHGGFENYIMSFPSYSSAFASSSSAGTASVLSGGR